MWIVAPILGRSQLTQDYGTDQYLLTLLSIPKSGKPISDKLQFTHFFDTKFNFTHQKGQICAFAILHLTFAFFSASEKTDIC